MHRSRQMRSIVVGIVIYAVLMAALLAALRMRFPH